MGLKNVLAPRNARLNFADNLTLLQVVLADRTLGAFGGTRSARSFRPTDRERLGEYAITFANGLILLRRKTGWFKRPVQFDSA